MSEFYVNNNLATVIGGQPAVGYIKIADSVFIQVNRKPFILHRFMMRMFFGWEWVKDWHRDQNTTGQTQRGTKGRLKGDEG